MFKLVMVPTSDKLPALKPWTPTDAALKWWVDQSNAFVVSGLGKILDWIGLDGKQEQQLQQVGGQERIFSRIMRFVGVGTKKFRSISSRANPSILLGERVDTEDDDILHVRPLP